MCTRNPLITTFSESLYKAKHSKTKSVIVSSKASLFFSSLGDHDAIFALGGWGR
ncbi:hypothetical protein J2128_000328 [Methanomicrobium sp. W14]|uniref:hypothetical protein n=1 Tax=Methanomicrobium sp. W14 TaxID=2817839 RepID=UPI001AE2E48B|nr:hypothetical protein [Methanomicrobium sp. W14]MBP2132407.1 hypothetical protein [Methanomicrobium sp. W14]